MKRILVNLTDQQLAELDNLVKFRVYSNRSGAIRNAILLLLEKEKLRELEKRIGHR